MKNIRRKMGAMFWAKAILYFGTLMNFLNYVYRQKDMEDNPEYYPDAEKLTWWDKTMFGNTIGNQTRLFTGRREDGTEDYIRWGKQFRELPELFFDDTGFNFPQATIKRLGAKAAPLVHYAFQMFTDKSPSGFTNYDLKDKRQLEWVIGVAKTTMKAALPYSTQSILRKDKEFKATDIFVPSSTGMTNNKARDLYEMAINEGDYEMLRQVAIGAVRNGLNPHELLKQTTSKMKADYLYEQTRYLRTYDQLTDRAAKFKKGSIEHLKITQKAQLTKNKMARVKVAYRLIELFDEKLRLDKAQYPELFKEIKD